MSEDARLGMYPLYRDSPSPDCEDDGGDGELVSNHRNDIVQKEKKITHNPQALNPLWLRGGAENTSQVHFS